MFEHYLPDPTATETVGRRLASACEDGLLVFLHGQLGAGKTTLVRGFLRASGHQGSVKSPTYTLVEPYATDHGALYHLDLYRLADPEELEWIGIRDLLTDESICLIEWPEQGAGILSEPDLHIYLRTKGQGREIKLKPVSPRGVQVVRNLSLSLQPDR